MSQTFQGKQSIESVLSKLIKPIKSKDLLTLFIVHKNWQNIISDKYYKYCKPYKITFSRDYKTATLYVKAFNSGVSFYLENHRLYLMEKTNIYFKSNLITKIVIKQEAKHIIEYCQKTEKHITASQKKEIQDIVKNVSDSSLKQELQNFGEIL